MLRRFARVASGIAIVAALDAGTIFRIDPVTGDEQVVQDDGSSGSLVFRLDR